MATKNVIHETRPLDNTVHPGTRVAVYLTGEGTLAERLRTEITIIVEKSDASPDASVTFTYGMQNDADVGTFAAGDMTALKQLLKKLHDQAVIDHGLA